MEKVSSDKNNLVKLTELIAKSDKGAFNTLFDLLWEQMYNYAVSIVMDTEIAKDIVQDVWIDYWQRRADIEIHHIKSYLFKAIRYSCYNTLRNQKFNETQVEAASSIFISSEMELEEDMVEMAKKINNSISSLSERCQEIFTLSRINNINNREIADKLNISQRSVENQISLALRKLRKDLAAGVFLYFNIF